MPRRSILRGAAVVGSFALLASAAPAALAQDEMSFEGVEISVVTFTGPQIAEPLKRRAPDFEALTGAKVTVDDSIPFADLYQRILTDIATGTNSYDAFVFAPQWMGDYIVPGFMEDLTDRIAADEGIQWEDVGPFFRDFSATYDGRIWTIPLDGDFHVMYYRKDILAEAGLEPPRTLDEYLAVAEALHGTDMNGDGEADYGSCISKVRNGQAYWFAHTLAAPYLQTQGTSQGAFFDDEMNPLVNNPGFAKALQFYKDSTAFGPPDELNLDVGPTRQLFTAGRCALSIDWGDIGTLALDPDTSVVQDKVGTLVTPGTSEVLDRETGELVPCDEMTCPHAIDGINYAPFAAYGGWSGGVNARTDDAKKDAAYAFLSYMSAPEQANEDVTIGKTGFNPYRISQFESTELWEAAGMSKEAAEDYLGAIGSSLNNPNMVLDLRIPQNQRYQQVVLDTAVAQWLAGELDLEGTMAQIEVGWNEITDELGREDQLAVYQASLGVER